jgi:hypothetical protein
MYSILYFWGAFYSIIITPAFITLYTLFKALTVNYIVRKKDNKTDEPIQKMNMISFIKNVFYYKKTFIIILTMIKLILSANSYLGTSYMLGVMIAILILIFGMNILVPNEVNDSLFSVLDFNFPSLNQQVPKEGSPIDMCNKEAYKEAINTTNINTNIGISKITNQPLDVLKINQNNPAQVAPTDPNNKMLGGKKEPIKSKQKLYKIKLV